MAVCMPQRLNSGYGHHLPHIPRHEGADAQVWAKTQAPRGRSVQEQSTQSRENGVEDPLAVLTFGLELHVLHHDVVDLAQRGAVFQDFPGLVGVEVDLDQLVIAHSKEAVALKVLGDVVEDLVLVQVVALDQQLRVKLEISNISSQCLYCMSLKANK